MAGVTSWLNIALRLAHLISHAGGAEDRESSDLCTYGEVQWVHPTVAQGVSSLN